jgi:hypothetical protein
MDLVNEVGKKKASGSKNRKRGKRKCSKKYSAYFKNY